MSYKQTAHKGRGRRYSNEPCNPVPPRELMERAYVRIRNANPDWTTVRVRQRAMVEMYFQPTEGEKR